MGPLKRAGLDADLLSSLLTRLKEESGAPVAHVIPSPADGQAASTETLRADLKSAKGGVVLAETMASGYGDKAASPMQDWAVRRIGADPPGRTCRPGAHNGEPSGSQPHTPPEGGPRPHFHGSPVAWCVHEPGTQERGLSDLAHPTAPPFLAGGELDG